MPNTMNSEATVLSVRLCVKRVINYAACPQGLGLGTHILLLNICLNCFCNGVYEDFRH